MNEVILMGRLADAPQVRYTTSGKVVCQIRLAVQRNFKNKDGNYDADFINVVIWGQAGERLGNTVAKGDRVMINGRIQVRSYEDKNKEKRWITEVVANNFEYIEPKNKPSVDMAAEFGEKSGFSFDEEIPF